MGHIPERQRVRGDRGDGDVFARGSEEGGGAHSATEEKPRRREGDGVIRSVRPAPFSCCCSKSEQRGAPRHSPLHADRQDTRGPVPRYKLPRTALLGCEGEVPLATSGGANGPVDPRDGRRRS
ncbi:hypothetical protein AAFF_G00286360 [Aldrovandia affinis]|uniref:Uncharacterized protein n=1 Tax=Aldrovandia affinis TaxID=143900 RepID=A0AAD7TAK4_9TELE|nr:hypothetical protein AAFF_G00286360 [Aldrovandia affinis]